MVKAPSRPNILLLTTDQQRFDTISAWVNNFPGETPHIDSLVNRGVGFENTYCTAPVCSPSRATWQTGHMPTWSGVPNNSAPPLDAGLNSIGQRMQAAGYETAYHGKSHLKGDLGMLGYDHAYENSEDLTTVLEAGRYWRNKDWRDRPRPFFHVVSLLNPHDIYFLDSDVSDPVTQEPWKNQNDPMDGKPEPPKSRVEDWNDERWQYYRNFTGKLMKEVDDHIGMLLEQLKRSGFIGNTWIIFTADHGDMAGEHGIAFKGPYMYEGVTHIPMIVIPPNNRLEPGKLGHMNRKDEDFKPFTCSAMASNLDIVPTILDIAGIETDPTLPGKSLLPVVKGEKYDGHEAVFSEWNEGANTIRMIRTKDWKYVVYKDHGEELYDMQNDPEELTNLATEVAQEAVKTDLRAKLAAFLEKENDPHAGLAK